MATVVDNVQEMQDSVFRKMSAGRKIKLVSDLTKFCLKLNQLNEYRDGRGTTGGDGKNPR